MPRDTPLERERPTLEAAVGRDRAAELRAELTAAGFEAIPLQELSELRRQAEGYRRMRALVDGDDA